MSAEPAATRTPKSKRTEDSPQREVIDLHCGICLEVVKNAVQSRCCGALWCSNCMKTAMATSRLCPNCRSVLTRSELVPDTRANREAAAIRRHCPYAQHGCPFEGNRSDLEEHAKDCNAKPIEEILKEVHRAHETTVSKLEAKHRRELGALASRLRTQSANVDVLIQQRDAVRRAMYHSTDRIGFHVLHGTEGWHDAAQFERSAGEWKR